MSDYFDYPQDARDTRQPTSPHLRPFYDEADHLRLPPPGWHLIPDPSNAIVACDDCGHQVGQHSSEGGVGCLHVLHRYHSLECPGQVSGVLTCPCLRSGTSRADQ